MMNRNIFNIVKEPRGELYRNLIEAAANQTTSAYLIVRASIKLHPSGRAALERLASHASGSHMVRAWPGTTLLGSEQAQMTEYRMNGALAQLIGELADGLFDWQQPDLPEDIGFLRGDGSVWLATTTHEHDAYFELTPDEFGILNRLVPRLSHYVEPATPDESDEEQ
jgi:hypothetical protein